MCGNTIFKERSEEERMMSKSLRMSMETVAFQTALDYSNTTPDLVTLTRHFGQQKKQDAAPGETAKAHGAELGEHSEQRGKKPDHGDSHHGSNGTTPGAGAGAGSRVGVTLFRTLLLEPLLLLFASLDLAILWCVLDGLKRSLDGAVLVGLGGIRDDLRRAAVSVRTHVLHSQRSDQSSNQC